MASVAGSIVISCEPGRAPAPARAIPVVPGGGEDVVAALSALPSVSRTRCRPARRPALSPGAANVFAVLGSLSTVALGYLAYALFAPVY